MIYLGDIELTKIYLGSDEIIAGFLGEDQIWPNAVDYTKIPLTFEVGSSGDLGFVGDVSTFSIEYSKNNGQWTSWTNNISVVSGDIIKFKGLCSFGDNTHFSATATINKVYGNLYSIFYNDNYKNITNIDKFCMCSFKGMTTLLDASNLTLPAATLSKNACYRNTFEGCTSLTTAPVLPATTLYDKCYENMFKDCTSLTTAPELPATTLATYCYSSMFRGCTSLTTAPSILPATTLKSECYQYMFINCTSLTTAPVLPATTLTNSCYDGMFDGCTNLNFIKCLATDISAQYCLLNWVYGVSSTGTFVKNDNMNSWTRGDAGIPSNWMKWNETQYDCLFKPLTFEFDNTGVFGYNNACTGPQDLEYSIDDGLTWNDGSNGFSININSTSKVQLRGNNCCFEEYSSGCDVDFYAKDQNDDYNTINVTIYGNFMSLQAKTGFETLTAFDPDYYGAEIFSYLRVSNVENLILPATTLVYSCYRNMFNANNSGIDKPFTTAPVLPAATLTEDCYANMFDGCANLNYVKCLATTNLVVYTLGDWLNNVSSTGTFVKKSGVTWPAGLIPSGWTIQND